MVMQRFSLEGKVAVVTGAAGLRGIGRAIALTLAEAGADVAVCDFKVKGEDFDLDGMAQEIKKLGRRCLSAKTDVSKESDVARFLEMVVGEIGTVDIMVNNAGHVGVAPLLQLTESLWDEVMGVNVKGVLFGSKAAAKIMMERRKGTIINMASIAGMRGAHPTSAYGTSKATVIHMTRWLAQELGPYGIRVNAIAPGIVDTDIARHHAPGSYDDPAEEAVEQLRQDEHLRREKIPLGRLGEPSDVADLALFLASDASRYITGQTIIVDGGVLLY